MRRCLFAVLSQRKREALETPVFLGFSVLLVGRGRGGPALRGSRGRRFPDGFRTDGGGLAGGREQAAGSHHD